MAATTLSSTSRLSRLRRAFSPDEWRRLAACYGVVVLLHVLGFGLFAAFVLPNSAAALGIGTAVLAYTFGLRHAFDADHIACIDNTTRKLMNDGQRPVAAGLFFSLGHSSVVLGLAVGIAFAADRLTGVVSEDTSPLHNIGGYIGTSVSAGFLYLIATLNLIILIGILRVFREMRRGRYDEAQLEQQLAARGLMNRFFGRLSRRVDATWKLYPLGFLFGLGFDTATEIALIVLTAGAAAVLPIPGVLSLPILFAAGMSLMDTTDGAFMSKAYGWAFARPVRKVYYNITITGLSVAVALLVGTIEIFSIIGSKLGLSGAFWDFVTGLDLNTIGFVIVGLFVVTWVIAFSVWKLARIEHRWALAPAGSATAAGDRPAATPAPGPRDPSG